MCRYAMIAYKPHYACFDCRKTFKRRLMSDISRGEESKIVAKCPECGSLMANMGKDFESPKKKDAKGWEHIKSLYSVGITFHSCGCTGPGYIPNTKEAIAHYFEELINDYHLQVNFWRQRKEPIDKREIESDRSKHWNYIHQFPSAFRSKPAEILNQEAIAFWMAKIREVENKLITIKKKL
jgi:DNA-directed RNA polymerase subunit RPC12/RpoP